MSDLAMQAKIKMWEEELDRYSSPIEGLFAMGLMWALSPVYVPGLIRWDFSFDTHTAVPEPARGGIVVWTQAPIGNYRIDFLLRAKVDDLRFFFAVECDGHEFHQRTKKQIEHDRKRDNALLAMDIATFRLPGSLIHRSPVACAVETLEQIEALSLRKVFTLKGHPELTDFEFISSARQRLEREKSA